MGLFELVFLGVAAIPFGFGVFGAWSRGFPQRSPLPFVWLAVALAVVVLSVPFGWLSGPLLYDALVVPGLVFVFGSDANWAQLACAVWASFAFALPGLAGGTHLVLSIERRPARAAVFGGLVGLGYVVGAGLLLWFARPTMVEFDVGVLDWLEMVLWGAWTTGVIGATFTGIAALAGSSREALRTVGFATLGLPAWALGIGAFGTPPDPLTQLLVAGPLVVAWLAGLAVGAVVLWLRGRATAG